MPLPTPNPNESREEFVTRFMKDPQAIADFPDESQRAAVAYNKLKGKKEGGESLDELTQSIIDNLERKEFTLEIKATDEEKGIIKAIASPYNNIDNGRDVVLPSIAKRNVGQKVPFLLQHEMSTEMGEVTFYDSPEGLMAEIQLYLDKDDDGQRIFPEALRTYVIAKRGMLKVSIGYRVYDFDNKVINGIAVRRLKDIRIMELSRVTNPMNEKAVATEVKEGGESVGDENKGMVTVPSLKEMMEGRIARDGMRMLMNTMRDMTYSAMNQPGLNKADRIQMMGNTVDEFAKYYKEYAMKICNAMPDDNGMKSEDIDLLELKFDDLVIEEKAGATMSKKTKANMQKALDAMMKGIEALKIMMGEEKPKSDDQIDVEIKSDDEIQPETDEEEETKANAEILDEFKALADMFKGGKA